MKQDENKKQELGQTYLDCQARLWMPLLRQKKNIKMKRTPQVMMNFLEAMILGHGRISRAWYYIYRPYFAFLFKIK